MGGGSVWAVLTTFQGQLCHVNQSFQKLNFKRWVEDLLGGKP